MIAALILAAGHSRRMGCCKQLLLWEGRSILAHVLELVGASGCQPGMLVIGGPYVHALHAVAEAYRFCCVFCPAVDALNPASGGQALSLKTGIRALLSAHEGALPSPVDGALIFLSDMPALQAASIQKIMEEARAYPHNCIIPTFQGRRGNPVYLPACSFEATLTLSGDVGARSLINAGTFPVRNISIDDPALLFDVDTPEDYALLQTSPKKRVDHASGT